MQTLEVMQMDHGKGKYGCETWMLTEDLQLKLKRFQTKGLRKLLDINMHHVQHLSISNEHVLNKAQVPCIMETMRQRQFRFLGKISRLPETHFQRRFLNAWIFCNRARRGSRYTLRNTQVDTLREIYGHDLSDIGILAHWVPAACNKTEWDKMAIQWTSDRQRERYETHGSHPILGPPGEN